MKSARAKTQIVKLLLINHMLCLLVGIYFRRTPGPGNLFLKRQALSKYHPKIKTFRKITSYTAFKVQLQSDQVNKWSALLNHHN